MKALTIRQPWAELIVSGKRLFEIRNWRPDYEGWILVHAGKKLDEEAVRRLNVAVDQLTFGAIIGKVRVDDCIDFSPESWEALRFQHMEWSDYQAGNFGWRLSKATKFDPPIPWGGSLGLFDVPDHVIARAEQSGI
jgi:hypothetical protein